MRRGEKRSRGEMTGGETRREENKTGNKEQEGNEERRGKEKREEVKEGKKWKHKVSNRKVSSEHDG